jgi:hypothetical protein
MPSNENDQTSMGLPPVTSAEVKERSQRSDG